MMATDAEAAPDGMNSVQDEERDIPDYMAEQMGGHDLIALFVLDDISTDTLNTILDQNADHISWPCLWLADEYDTLPDYRGSAESGTETPIDPEWRSPFIGKTIPDVVAFMRNTPKPPKPLSKRYCAVLTKDSLDEETVLICRPLEGDSGIERDLDELGEHAGRDLKQVFQDLGTDYENVQVIPTDMERVGEFHHTFEEYKWPECYIEWREDDVGLG